MKKKDLRSIPIPAGSLTISTVDYHSAPFDFRHKLTNDHLVACASEGLLCRPFYAQADGLNFPYSRKFRSACREVFLRRGAVQRLLKVDRFLRPYAVRLCLLDGYRRIDTQREIWAFYCEWAKARHPTWSAAQIAKYAAKYASDPRNFDPNDFTTWPVHCTGGAIDLTLVSLTTQESIFMGGIFDDPSAISATNYFELARPEPDSASSFVALQYRRVLYHAMTRHGFQNYPREWWHFDWGTQLWAQQCSIHARSKSRKKAFYGYVEE